MIENVLENLDIPDGTFYLQQAVCKKNANNTREKYKWSLIRCKMQKTSLSQQTSTFDFLDMNLIEKPSLQ